MADPGIIELERPGTREQRSSGQQNGGTYPHDAEQIERVVDVAEWLGISPTVAAVALRRSDGEVRTDLRLAESVRRAGREIRRET